MDSQTIIDTVASMGVMAIYLFVIVAMVAFMMTITGHPSEMPKYENQPEPPKKKL